jgi:nitrogen regulatory protein PII
MKRITAIIKPFKLDDVRAALVGCDVQGVTVTEVRGIGRALADDEQYRGSEQPFPLSPRLKLDVVVTDDDAMRVADAIVQAAQTGATGDGKLFMADVGQAFRIRTGEMNETAL